MRSIFVVLGFASILLTACAGPYGDDYYHDGYDAGPYYGRSYYSYDRYDDHGDYDGHDYHHRHHDGDHHHDHDHHDHHHHDDEGWGWH